MRKFMNKKIAAVAAGAVLLTGTGVAYAYWTTTASGDGSATNASSNGVLTLVADWDDDALYPGGSQEVSFTASNPGATTLRLGTIVLDSVEASDPDCAVGDFTMEDVVADQSIETTTSGTPPVDTPEAVVATGTLEFANDSDTSQDACKGATITLNVSSADPNAPE